MLLGDGNGASGFLGLLVPAMFRKSAQCLVSRLHKPGRCVDVAEEGVIP